jgi:hypothetical protein
LFVRNPLSSENTASLIPQARFPAKAAGQVKIGEQTNGIFTYLYLDLVVQVSICSALQESEVKPLKSLCWTQNRTTGPRA